MNVTRTQQLSAAEARQLHQQALVIDTQQPFITSDIAFTPRMREVLGELHSMGRTRVEARKVLRNVLAEDVRTSEHARRQYLEVWQQSGVTAACGTYCALEHVDSAFEESVREIANAMTIISSLDDHMLLARNGADIEHAHDTGKHAVVIDFQNVVAFGDRLERVELFYGLGLRMVQLSYNLQNLAATGCTEWYQPGLSYFGRELVARLNSCGILVDVSHCSEQVGWDAMEISSAPVIVSHSSSKSVAMHDRGKSDELARAIAEQGGIFGVVVVPGFIKESPGATLKDAVRHVEHLVDICGIDHVAIGTDKGGPGPTTGTMIEFPEDMPFDLPGEWGWSGFRDEEHRITLEYNTADFEKFDDWPNLTVALAEAGFSEEDLRKILGQNFLRVFREVVG